MTAVRKYISDSLEQIIGGLEDFAKSQGNNGATPFAEIGGAINNLDGMAIGVSKKIGDTAYKSPTIMTVNFEIGVTVENDKLAVAGGALKIPGVAGAEGKGETHSKNANINKLSFSVPVQLPIDPFA